VNNDDIKIKGLDFDTPESLEWNPIDPLDCDVWAHAVVGANEWSNLYQLHICSHAAMKRIDNKQHVFVIERYAGKEDLIARLNDFIVQKTSRSTSDGLVILTQFWRWEYGKYDKRGKLLPDRSY
jgi:hypothetical protein